MKLTSLVGKTALVTGASSGFGAHFAQVLAEAGAHVIVGARRVSALETLAEKIIAGGGSAEAITLDVTDRESIRANSDALGRSDILINNAGITRESPMLEMSEDDWDVVMDTNTKGMFLMTQAVAQSMRNRNVGGSIVNIASILGLRQAGTVASYASSKAAAIQLTKVSALELARFGIRVNAIAPGFVKTDLTPEFFDSDACQAMIKRIPQRRLGTLADLNGPLLLLASDASSYMNGAVIAVDGGHLVNTL